MSDKPGFLESFSPWTSRTNTPKINEGSGGRTTPNPGALGQKQVIDHSVSHHRHISARDYPNDCPRSNIRWFYAVDVRSLVLISIYSPYSRGCSRLSESPAQSSPARTPNPWLCRRSMRHSQLETLGLSSRPFNAWSKGILLRRRKSHQAVVRGMSDLRSPDQERTPA